MTTRYLAGVDIGGTFTDLVLMGDDGTVHAEKLPTTPDDFGRSVATGLRAALDRVGTGPDAVETVVHGTTVATNAILEGKSARTGLLTTEGFRDVLELRRLRIPEMYTLNWIKPPPIVPRRRRLEVRERIGPHGEVRVPLDEADVAGACERLAGEGVAAVAISYLHAYANPDHERRTADIAREILGSGVFITCSSDILPEIREYERTSTTVINACLGPVMAGYFDSLGRHLKKIGVTAPVRIMKSDGGAMSIEAAARKPAHIVESGPAAGVVGAARHAPSGDSITLDMGGTTAKASMVENGRIARTGDYEVGAGINLSSKLVMGGGYALKLPVIDISEIGAGGGSIITFDRGGLMKVGPESAGAVPGPVCYGRGGTDPTLTDALLALGYLNPDHLVGGDLTLDADRARAVLKERVGASLGRSLTDAAWGAFQIGCNAMVRAVKAVTTYRGRDPRDFSLFAFGGNGPTVAAEIADMLDMRRVVIPPAPGVFSAYGLLLADIQHETSCGWLRPLSGADPEEMEETFLRLEETVKSEMRREGCERYAISRHADLRYAGQAHELTVSCDERPPDFIRLASEFGDEHERTYGHKAEAEAVECVTLRAIARAAGERAENRKFRQPREAERMHVRRAYFGLATDAVETPVMGRNALPQTGPVILEEYDSTCVVPPGWSARTDEVGNIVLEKGA